MTKVLRISAALVAFGAVACGSALAADLRPMVKAPPMVAPLPPPFSWTGFYIGANIGGAWAGGNFISNNGASFDVGSKGAFVGGGQFGYNWQFNNIVLGIEGTIDGIGSNNRTTNPVTINGTMFNATGRATWDGTIAARLGYAVDHWLFYAKGGGGFVGFDATVNNLTNGGSVSKSTTQGGWMAGAGIEWAFTQNWTAKLEYQYLGINGEQVGSLVGNTFTLNNPNVQQVTVGVNYLFH